MGPIRGLKKRRAERKDAAAAPMASGKETGGDWWDDFSRRISGATLTCGTGACAVVVAAVLEGHAQRACIVDLPGGPLEIEWREEDNHVYMTGPAEVVFYGSAPV